MDDFTYWPTPFAAPARSWVSAPRSGAATLPGRPGRPRSQGATLLMLH